MRSTVDRYKLADYLKKYILFIRSWYWRIYHLTYSSDNASKYPLYKEFVSRREVAEYLQEIYVNGV